MSEVLTRDELIELGNGRIEEGIKTTGNIEQYLTPQKIQELNLSSYDLVELIKATGHIE